MRMARKVTFVCNSGKNRESVKYLYGGSYMKKVFLAFLLVFLFSFNVTGEETRKHFLYGGVNTFFHFPAGLNIGYEYSINNNFSISLDFGNFVGPFPYATTTVRWYPGANIFFVGLGAGVWFASAPRYVITPAIGWRISLGQGDRWFIMPNLAGLLEIFPRRPEPFIRANLSVGFNW